MDKGKIKRAQFWHTSRFQQRQIESNRYVLSDSRSAHESTKSDRKPYKPSSFSALVKHYKTLLRIELWLIRELSHVILFNDCQSIHLRDIRYDSKLTLHTHLYSTFDYSPNFLKMTNWKYIIISLCCKFIAYIMVLYSMKQLKNPQTSLKVFAVLDRK